jgi:hypothetical protein
MLTGSNAVAAVAVTIVVFMLIISIMAIVLFWGRIKKS